MKSFILEKKRKYIQKSRVDSQVIRVSPQTYKVLCDLSEETDRSIMSIADRAIAYAIENLELIDPNE